MNCARAQEKLEARLALTTPANAQAVNTPALDAELARHVEGCPTCRAFKQDLQAATGAFSRVALEPLPRPVHEEILRLTGSMPVPQRPLGARVGRWLQALTESPARWGPALAAPALAILLIFGLSSDPGGETPEPPTVIDHRRVMVASYSPPGAAFSSLHADDRVSGPGRIRYMDGTEVQLTAGSRARVRPRTLDLSEGRALLTVAHDGSDFTVQAPRFSVHVLGTTFAVQADGEVQLLEGKVEVRAEAGGHATLRPGQSVRVRPGEVLSPWELGAGDREDLLDEFRSAWSGGRLPDELARVLAEAAHEDPEDDPAEGDEPASEADPSEDAPELPGDDPAPTEPSPPAPPPGPPAFDPLDALRQ